MRYAFTIMFCFRLRLSIIFVVGCILSSKHAGTPHPRPIGHQLAPHNGLAAAEAVATRVVVEVASCHDATLCEM